MNTKLVQLIAVIALFMGAMFNLSAHTPADDSNEELKAKVAEITLDCHSDYEKAWAIYKWIIQNVEYDEAIILEMYEDIQMKVLNNILKEGRMPSKEELQVLCFHYLAEENALYLNQGAAVFETHKGICSSISHLYKLMCEAAGLKCKIVIGLSVGRKDWNGHAWNIVIIGGQKHLVDVTQGISSVKFVADKGLALTNDILDLLEKYFLIDPYDMLASGYFPFRTEDQCLPYEISYKGYTKIAYTSPIKRHGLLKDLELYNACYSGIECEF